MLNRRSTFDKLLDKATSNLLLDADWDLNIQICDLIRQKDVQPKHALEAIRKKLKSENPNVLFFTLLVLESCMKNCGPPFHAEVVTKSFMSELHGILQVTTAEKVRGKILELIQTWHLAFKNEPKYYAIGDLLAIIKMEGYKLPEKADDEKMYTASVAPLTIDSDCCFRCRVKFSLLQRKSPCMNCGHTFCGQCTSHKMPLPHFEIDREVPVCESCWQHLRESSVPPKLSSSTTQMDLKAPMLNKGEETDKDLKMAIELSIQEDEKKKTEARNKAKELELVFQLSKEEEERKLSQQIPKECTTDNHFTTPELIHYLDREYWERKQQKISAGRSNVQLPKKETQKITTRRSSIVDRLHGFSEELKYTLQVFVNRLETIVRRGRSIVNDTYVQSLFGKISSMNFQLISYLEELSGIRTYYESLQDKIYQLQDGIAAFRALKNEYTERQAQLAKKERFLREIQMAQKVREVRKQKQEILQAEARRTLLQLQKTKQEMLMKRKETDINAFNTEPYPPIATTSMEPTCPPYPYNPYYADHVPEVNLPLSSQPGLQDIASNREGSSPIISSNSHYSNQANLSKGTYLVTTTVPGNTCTVASSSSSKSPHQVTATSFKNQYPVTTPQRPSLVIPTTFDSPGPMKVGSPIHSNEESATTSKNICSTTMLSPENEQMKKDPSQKASISKTNKQQWSLTSHPSPSKKSSKPQSTKHNPVSRKSK